MATTNRKSRKAMLGSRDNGRRSGGGNSSPPGLEQAVELVMGVMPKELEGMALEDMGAATKEWVECSPSGPSSQASEGSTSALSVPVCELCGSASRTPTGGGSLPDTGPGSLAMRTCVPLWPTPNAGGGTGYMSGSKRDTWRPTLNSAVKMAPEGPAPRIQAESGNPGRCPCRCHASMSSAEGFPAKTSPTPAGVRGSTGPGRVFGGSSQGSLANWDPATSLWRMSQLSLLEEEPGLLETLPRSGMTVSGTVFQLLPLAPLTGGTGSGLLPTPTEKANHMAPSMRKHPGMRMLQDGMWPTPQGSDGDRGPSAELAGQRPSGSKRALDLTTAASHSEGGGSLNPTWVEWLMGFPTGWTALPPSETR